MEAGGHPAVVPESLADEIAALLVGLERECARNCLEMAKVIFGIGEKGHDVVRLGLKVGRVDFVRGALDGALGRERIRTLTGACSARLEARDRQDTFDLVSLLDE